jgi:hypothetical protein
MLIPVSSAGVLRSVQQMLTGQKGTFSRTPKVGNWTSMPPLHIVLQFGLLTLITAAAATHLLRHQYSGFLCAINAAFLLYGSAVLIGWREAYNDLVHALRVSDYRRRSHRDRAAATLAFNETIKNRGSRTPNGNKLSC